MNTIYTIGHSNRPIEQFLDMLKAHGIQEVADVRTVPKSRHNPQFGQEALSASLKDAGMEYFHMKNLGGLRHPSKDSPNTGWRNASFRGYADYMATGEFQEALRELEQIAREKHVAIMCAEAVPWRCHRSLIADALTTRGWRVLNIQSKKTVKPHELTPFLKVQEGKLCYPAP